MGRQHCDDGQSGASAEFFKLVGQEIADALQARPLLQHGRYGRGTPARGFSWPRGRHRRRRLRRVYDRTPPRARRTSSPARSSASISGVVDAAADLGVVRRKRSRPWCRDRWAEAGSPYQRELIRGGRAWCHGVTARKSRSPLLRTSGRSRARRRKSTALAGIAQIAEGALRVCRAAVRRSGP